MSIYSLDEKAPMCVGWSVKKSSMKKSKLKARRMWANFYRKGCACHPTRRACDDAMRKDLIVTTVPVAVIPLDDVPALVRTAGDAFHDSYDGHICQADIVAMLTAIGVLPKQRKGRK